MSWSAKEVHARGRHLHRKQRSFCSLPTANAKSLLWDLYRYSWATLCHFPRSRGDGELLSPDDVQAGALPPVGQGPTFSMRPGDGWVRAPRGLVGTVLVSVSLLRLGLFYSLSLFLSLSLSLSLSEPQLQFCCSPLFKRDNLHLLGKMKRSLVSWQVEGRLEALGISPATSTAQPQDSLLPYPEGAQGMASHLEPPPPLPWPGPMPPLLLVWGQQPCNP